MQVDTFNKWRLLSTDNLLDMPLIYCICGDIDDKSTSKFDGINSIDTLMDDVISDGADGKSKARNIYMRQRHTMLRILILGHKQMLLDCDSLI